MTFLEGRRKARTKETTFGCGVVAQARNKLLTDRTNSAWFERLFLFLECFLNASGQDERPLSWLAHCQTAFSRPQDARRRQPLSNPHASLGKSLE